MIENLVDKTSNSISKTPEEKIQSKDIYLTNQNRK